MSPTTGSIVSTAEIAFANGFGRAQFSATSTVQEVQETLKGMSPEDRSRVKAFLLHLSRVNDPAHKADMTRRLQAMEQGDRVTQAQVEKMHEDLCREGR